jgi:Uma2 family endonuclease
MFKTRITAAEFEAFVDLPENIDKLFELIGGEIVEVPSNPFVSHISISIAAPLKMFVKEHDLGHVTGEAGGYMVSGERYAPAVAFISKKKPLAKEGYNPAPPDLAVEVDFPSSYESQRNLRTKIVNYLAAGTVVWLVLPESQEVEIYEPGQPKKTIGLDGVLEGGDILPGFKLAVKDIFPEENG